MMGMSKEMHPQMQRLYQAAKKLKGILTQAELAAALNESSQTIKNWEYRGISKRGMIEAQKVIGCSAEWLQTGKDPMNVLEDIPDKPDNESSTVYWPFPITPDQYSIIKKERKDSISEMMEYFYHLSLGERKSKTKS